MSATPPTGFRSGFCSGPLHSYCPVVVAGHPCVCDCHQQPELEPELTVHCALGCGYLVVDTNPEYAHDAMERHYGERHPAPLPARHCPTCTCGATT